MGGGRRDSLNLEKIEKLLEIASKRLSKSILFEAADDPLLGDKKLSPSVIEYLQGLGYDVKELPISEFYQNRKGVYEISWRED